MNIKYDKKSVIFILQLAIAINAINFGWSINTFDTNKIILSKKRDKISDIDNNLDNFMKNIVMNVI